VTQDSKAKTKETFCFGLLKIQRQKQKKHFVLGDTRFKGKNKKTFCLG
jgi:hypothetical protein